MPPTVSPQHQQMEEEHCGEYRRKRYHVYSLPIEVRSGFDERSKSRSLNLRTVAFTSDALPANFSDCCALILSIQAD